MKRMLVGLALATAVLGLPATVIAGSGQPDIVVVMVDDLGYIADERILQRLPNIKSLFLDNGLRLTNLYGENPWCCPGRAAFLSGQHNQTNGIVDLTHPNALNANKTLAVALHDAGYHTGLIGKYLNHAEKLTDRTPPGWDQIDISHTATSTRDTASSSFYLDGVQTTLTGQWDRVIGDRSTAFVNNAPADRPLFLMMTPRGPHAAGGGRFWQPWVESSKDGDARCKGIPLYKPPSYQYVSWVRNKTLGTENGWPLTDICEAMLTIDDGVGNVRDAMAARSRPAVWLFMSDNGMSWGAHGQPQKENPWSTQLPGYFAGSGVPTGTRTALVSNIDLAPTLASRGGATMPWADGEPIALDGPGRDWMLEDFPATGDVGFGKWWAIRTPTWHYVVRVGVWVHLYNLANDPWEQNSVKNTAKRQELRALDPFGR